MLFVIDAASSAADGDAAPARPAAFCRRWGGRPLSRSPRRSAPQLGQHSGARAGARIVGPDAPTTRTSAPAPPGPRRRPPRRPARIFLSIMQHRHRSLRRKPLGIAVDVAVQHQIPHQHHRNTPEALHNLNQSHRHEGDCTRPTGRDEAEGSERVRSVRVQGSGRERDEGEE